ncbi:AP-1-like transcription factor YAP3 [Lasiodiplodia theobromae]|uniref:AP-1-like transcription factor YAP3 n=1 Tax=Lasiodiplodia theobromae TaxID=45133 RepID=A0A5N5D903_9PEZI|nr:AP-1-like transcription factor YAP3 [Lasiodiplodia theobromae]
MKLKWLPNLRSPKESEQPPEQALSKRREQVRRAQRTHRERKEAYTKALEAEVLQLRTNEANLMQETQRLNAAVKRLKATLDLNGIQVPWSESDEVTSDASSPEDVSTRSIVTIEDIRTERRIRVRQAAVLPQTAVPTLPSQKPRVKQQEASNTSVACDRGYPDPSGKASTCMKDSDLASLGVDFVLTLESPCLSHMEHTLNDSSAPAGHALTASAPLLFRGSSGTTAQVNGSPSWEVPNTGLDRLLDLSSNLPLAEEITPVQAWNHIRCHPEFNRLEVQRLQDLASKLLKHVECHGFGAVIELSTFEGLANEAMRHAG